MAARTAVVTGAARGIGVEVARGLVVRGMRVVVTARDEARAAATAEGLAGGSRGEVLARVLDVADLASVEAFGAWADEALDGRVDVLVNNAGVYPGASALDEDMGVVGDALATNAIGPWRLAQVVAPGMARRGWGRIVNVSSGAGSLARMGRTGTPAAYNVSKAALNAITRMLAVELEGRGVLVNAVDPGWVATDMGGRGAPRTVEQGAASVLWAVDLPDDGPTGGFYFDGRATSW